MLELLSSEMIHFSLDGVCLKITRDTVTRKEKSWKRVEKYSRFTTMFANLGNSWGASEEDLKLLKEFVCHLYEGKGKSVDELRYKKFENVYRTKNKIQDLSLLPPCRRSLVLHLK